MMIPIKYGDNSSWVSGVQRVIISLSVIDSSHLRDVPGVCCEKRAGVKKSAKHV